jgi:hypothetical protein
LWRLQRSKFTPVKVLRGNMLEVAEIYVPSLGSVASTRYRL